MALGICDGTEMLYIEYCTSPSTSTLCLAVGRRVRMEVSAMGRAYLWDQAEADRQQLLERIAAQPRAGVAQALQHTHLAFAQLDSEGFCTADGEYHRDIWGSAVPLRLGRPGMPMALSCSGMTPAPCERRIREVVAPALKQTAQKLRDALAAVDSGLF
jgi:DNA-binding IclR family transcriptional regulator